MDKSEALVILEGQLERYRRRGYAELLALLDEAVRYELPVAGGTTYQVVIDAVWDADPGGDLRVIGRIDDGGWRALSPLTSDFIISPDGSFVGE